MGAGIWLGAILHRLRHPVGNRAAGLSGTAAMTDEERRMFSNRLRERDAEIEWLRTALQEIEALNGRAAISDAGKIMRALNIARRALEPKP